MGLHDSLLEVPERLRVWQLAGVRHFYLTPGADGETSSASNVSEPSLTASEPGTAPEAAIQAQSAAVAPLREKPVAARTQDGPAAEASRQPAVPEPEPAGPRPLPDDPARWPAPWASIFAKTPASPRLVITYRDLGLDLTGRADARRGNLWRGLLRELGLAGQGAVAFWPFALPQAGETVARADIFAAGLDRLRPRVLAVFGDFPPTLLPRDALPGMVRETLPDPRVLLDGDTEAWDHVVEVLGRLV